MLVEHDPQAVATAIEYLRNNREEASRMGQAGAGLVAERWSVAAAVDRLEQNLHTVLNEFRTSETKL